ncbi:nuclear hormone receptor HR96-like [Uloborus diversus]|uniref:nuclear hormone receptor HR96-like n=1 Tax=Uloborus diversus TaxID=327109 RepID=UPI002408F5F8|nr:nuclear hormone receptor HR96-like [Uloborus diversus]XP_054723179.1 nuclear hormone receptor HR96-like [Uloborus diversus]XP_054723188.1 nuclear hormone receptor HR96-like [Uloborus diversus]XP_054723194.1 nuclear hormone receptor HR96-like [Uloborus diversus]
MAETRRKKDNKTCGVCGDLALGSNFNAITCESCKAFFRRNALKPKEFNCPFENNCNVDRVTRRFCQKCRLKKCFAIGMKKEWIMSEEEKKAKREKIEKNRLKRNNQQAKLEVQDLTYIKVESPDDSQVLLSPLSTISPMTPQTPGSIGMTPDLPKTHSFNHQPLTPSDCEYSPPAKIMHLESTSDTTQDATISDDSNHQEGSVTDENSEIVEALSDSETSLAARINSADCSNSSSQEKPCDVQSPKTNLFIDKLSCKTEDLPPSAYAKAVEIEFTELPIRTSTNSNELNTLEKQKLHELLLANEILKLPLVFGFSDPSLIDVINMTDHAIRRLIKMSKKITAFKNLCQDDQIALLKGGCTELMILRSVMSYDPEKNCWEGSQAPPGMSIKVDVLKEAKGNLYEEHKRFLNSFHPQWRADENIMLILGGIALFTPERPNTIHKETIKLEQDTYYYLLRRYLDTVYSWCDARTIYLKLIHKIQELHILNENHVRVYLDVNPKDVEPLLIEIFDLKH